MANHMLKRNLTIDEVMAKFDRNSDGYISPEEFRTIIIDINAELTRAEIDSVARNLDINQDNRLSVREIKTSIQPKLQAALNNLKQQKINNNKAAKDQLVESVVSYMQRNRLTIYDLYKRIDSNHDSIVNRLEFGKFLRGLGIQGNDKQMDELIDIFDYDKNGRVQFDEFVNTIKPYLSKPLQVDTGSNIEGTLTAMASYMKEKNMATSTMFTTLDRNNDGFVNRLELTEFLKRLGCTDAQCKDVVSEFDRNGDDRIDIKEFIKTMTPYVEKAQKQGQIATVQSPQTPAFQKLNQKLREIVTSKYTELRQAFNIYAESGSSFITKENFKTIFSTLNVGLTPSEVSTVLESSIQTNSKGEVNWENFLSTYREQPNINDSISNSRVAESQYISNSQATKTLKRSNTVERIFSSISKILKDNKIGKKEAFTIFDKDKSGAITYSEFK